MPTRQRQPEIEGHYRRSRSFCTRGSIRGDQTVSMLDDRVKISDCSRQDGYGCQRATGYRNLVVHLPLKQTDRTIQRWQCPKISAELEYFIRSSLAFLCFCKKGNGGSPIPFKVFRQVFDVLSFDP